MKEEAINSLILVGSLVAVVVVAGLIFTASGKSLVLEVDGLSGRREDGYGNFQEQHVDGGRFKFYAE